MIMRSPRFTRAGLAAALVLTVLGSSLAAGDSPNSPFSGLELVASKNVGALYRRPDADLSAYDKIMIGDPAVEFSKNWNPRNYGTFGLSAAQLTKIRTDLAAMAKSTFSQVLSGGGYQIVTEAGDGVMQITPNVVNVYINAPQVPTAGRSKTYTMDAGLGDAPAADQ